MAMRNDLFMSAPGLFLATQYDKEPGGAGLEAGVLCASPPPPATPLIPRMKVDFV